MNRKKLTTMLLLVASTATASIALDNNIAFADTNKSSVSSNKEIVKGKVINVETSLRIRKNASTSSEIIGCLKEGETFDILGKDGAWYKIKSGNKSGYIHSDYVKVINSNSSTNNQSSSQTGVVTNAVSGLRVRKGASTSTETLGNLKNGDKLDIISKSGKWYKIKYKGSYGYVHEDYVKATNNGNSNNSSSNNSGNTKPESRSQTGVVTNATGGLRVRKGSSTKTETLGYLKNGDKLDIVSKSGSWYKIKYKGSYGYVHEDYVKITSGGSNNNNNSSNSKPESSSHTGVVTNITSQLRVRKGASTSAETLGYLKNGDKLDIVSKSGSWYKIKYKGSYGYVHEDYVKITSGGSNNNNNSSNSKPESSSHTGVVTNITSQLRVRKGASTSAETLGYLKNGDKLDIVSKSGSWYKIKYKGSYGYVHEEYVKITNGGSSNNSSNNNGNSSSSSNKYEGTGKVINITSNLRVRKGAGTNYSVVGYLLEGDTFDVLGKSGSWYKIKKGSIEGYVLEDYVKFYPKTSSSTPENKPEKPEVKEKYGKVQVSSELRIREKASTSAKIIGNLGNGEIVEILGEENGFYKIKDGNTIGYSSKEYIKEISKDEINSSNPGESAVMHTNYNMSLNSYIKLQQSRVSYSYDYYEGFINPNKATNQFQFLRLDEYRHINVSGLNSYFAANNSGVLEGQAQAFVNASKKFDIDPLYFAAQSIHETGYGKSKLAKGVKITEIANTNKEIKNSKGQLIGYEMIKLDKPVTVYNLFGIGAYDNSDVFPNRALILGTTYAYNHGWTSIDKAIEGAASFVSSNYVNSSTYKQNTLYKMRYAPNTDLVWHQYATTPWYAQEIGQQMEQMKYLYTGNNDFIYDKPKFN